MRVEIGGLYKTRTGNYLRLISTTDVMYNFLLVDKNNILITEKRNRFGHVVLRSNRQYSEEIMMGFKFIK